MTELSAGTLDLEDTIVAVASPTSPAARGVVRLTGEGLHRVVVAMGIDPGIETSPRRFDALVSVAEPIERINVSVLWWPTNRTYTGQPSAELHTYGCLPILTALVDSALSAGARAARPGEFTMRAFLSGRLDLTQAEAVLGVIEAEQRGTLDHALRQLAGNLSRPLEEMRSAVLDLLADVEAGLDFVDEDIEFISDQALVERLRSIDEQLESTWQNLKLRRGGSVLPRIAFRGEPNAGKSCLINALSNSQAAIVADVPGTTRDVVTVTARLAGREVKLIDTAGIEEGRNQIERHSQDHAGRASLEADVRLWCVDASRADFDQASRALRETLHREQRESAVDLWVATKSDLVADRAAAVPPAGWIAASAFAAPGLEPLVAAIDQALSSRDSEETGSVLGTAARCRDSLSGARDAIARAIELMDNQQGHEFVATELRTVATCLGEVTGAVYTDDILDRVFSRFCIGK